MQLLIDDKLLAIPSKWFDKFSKNARYGYLYLPESEYGGAASRVILSKIEAVFYFLRILEGCYEFERRDKGALFEELIAKKVTPDFRAINHEMLNTTSRLLGALNKSHEYPRFVELETTLRYDDRFEEFFSTLPNISRMIKK